MKKIFKRIDLLLVFIITLLACSGCFESGSSRKEDSPSGPVSLISMPATTTVRFMNEALYIGYLGAQRDFALIVDNAGYNLSNHIQSCDVEIGCASNLTKMLMNFGISTSAFTGESSGENVLLYYATSTDFDKFGATSEDNSWYSFFTGDGDGSNALQNSDFSNSEIIQSLSCGTSYSKKSYVCNYSKEMTTNGYSTRAGNSMILLFENGQLYDVVTDKQIDPSNTLNRSDNNNLDQLDFREIDDELENKYYENVIHKLRSRINVSNATNNSQKSASSQTISEIKNLNELTTLVNGGKGVDDYLLLITSNGFISNKVGTNYSVDENGNEIINESLNSTDPNIQAMTLLFNTVSTYTDNCALESEPLLNFLRGILQALISGYTGTLLGAAAGAGIGALVGLIVPVIGSAIGAGVGAIAGAIAGFFAGIEVNKAIEEKLKSANGISNNSYCRIITSALDEVEINVPIYNYNISKAGDNVEAYRNGDMSDSILRDYYNENYDTCRYQATEVAVPSGLLSLITNDPSLNDRYAYADICEKEVVSDLVGGVYASPSLQLVLDGKKVDDLNGRVTSELITEMLYIWGLKSIGNMYTIASSGNLNDMSVTVGSAKEISNVKYCITNQITPNCTDGERVPLSGNNYIGATNKGDGITIQFVDEYKAYSRNNIGSLLTNGKVNSMVANLTMDSNNAKQYLVSPLSSLSSDWGLEIVKYGEESLENELEAIVDKAKNAINTYKDYQIKYKGIYYVICSSGEIVGYKLDSNDNMILVYYSEGSSGGNEYIFEGYSTGSENVDNYYNNKLYHDATTDIDSGHDVYIYIAYDIKDEEGNNKTIYYSYAI